MIYLARESAGHGIFDSIKKSSPSEQKMLAHEQKKREEQDKVRRPLMSQEKSRGYLARRLNLDSKAQGDLAGLTELRIAVFERKPLITPEVRSCVADALDSD